MVLAISTRISYKHVQFWLLGIAVGLIAIHLTLVWRIDDSSLFVSSLVFWLAIANLIWAKRHTLQLTADPVASLLGAALLGLILAKSTAITGWDFLRFYPFGVGVSMMLLASGWRGWQQYWRELTLLFFLGIPGVIIPSLIDISELTARFATALLWYCGFDLTRHGTHIYLSGGGIEVYPGCAGLQSMMQVLGIAILFLILLPVRWNWRQMLGFPLIALWIGFIVNGMRVALMAILVAAKQQSAFEYWHKGTGSLLFSMIAVLLFVLTGWGLVRQSLVLASNPIGRERP